MKRLIFVSLFLLGITSIISQLALVREIIITFYGNELFYGLFLGFWLFWAAVGAITLNRILNWLPPLKILIFSHFLISFIFLFEIIFVRAYKIFFPNIGEGVDIILRLFYVFFAISPLCIMFGLHFAVAGRFFLAYSSDEPNILKRFFKWLKKKFTFRKKEDPSDIINNGYLFEILGLAFGALIYSFIVIYFGFFEVFLFLLALNFLILYFTTRFGKIRVLLIVIFAAIFMIYLATGFLNGYIRQTELWRFPGQNLVKSANSSYGNISITQTGNYYNFYGNGFLVGSNKDDFSAEEAIHLPMLYHKNPKNVLLIGNGFGGAFAEILKYNVDNFDYQEIDDSLIKTVMPYLEVYGEYDKKINFIFYDIFLHLKTNKDFYDVIIVNIANQSNLQSNRLYSVDFFNLVQKNLKEGGIMALNYSPLIGNLPSESFTSSIYKGLNNAFFYVNVLPTKNYLYLASDSRLDVGTEILQSRLKKYNFKNNLITTDYLKQRLNSEELKKTLEILKKDNFTAINSNTNPVAYWQNNLSWFLHYYPSLSKPINFISNISLSTLFLICFILFFGLYYISDVLVERRERILAVINFIPQLSFFSAVIIFILLFQINYGIIYHRLSFIFAMIFLGMSVGAWLVKILNSRNKIKFSYIFRLYFIFGLYFVFLALILDSYPNSLSQPVFFYCLVFITGLFAGFEFPLINKYYLRDKLEPIKKTGIIYSSDLIGSAFGAIFTSIFLLPVLGFNKSLIFIGFLNFLAFAVLFFLRQNFEDS